MSNFIDRHRAEGEHVERDVDWQIIDRLADAIDALAFDTPESGIENAMNDAINTLAGIRDGDYSRGRRKVNIRAGFHHIHSGEDECGMAYRDRGQWWPCSRLLNHEGTCGHEDNSAF